MYKELQKNINSWCDQYVRAFCDIMDYSYNDYYFVGDDPFGVVAIGDEFWNMSDIFQVINEYDHWIETHGSVENLRKAIFDWYFYSLDVHEKNMEMQEAKNWVSVKDRLPDDDSFVWVTNHSWYGADHYKDGKWYGEDMENPQYYDYWKLLFKPGEDPKPIPCINLKSWLMGARPDMEKPMEHAEANRLK